MTKAYKHVYYDRWNKQICIRYVGDSTYTKVPYVKDYWVKDPTGQSKITDMYGVPMVHKTNLDKDVIKTLKANGIQVAESDFKEEVKYMHDVYDKEELTANVNDWNICLFDIEIESGAGFPKPEEALFPINLITCYSSQTKQTYTWGNRPYTGSDESVVNYRYFENELDLLKDWLKWFHNQNFDVISGWNSILFDIPYIVNRIKNVRNAAGIKTEYESALSPLGKRPEGKDVSDKKIQNDLGSSYDIPGLIHHDYMELYKTFASHGPMESFSLNYVSMTELNEGKLEYEGTINQIYKTDWNKFVEYNIQDVMLLVKLEKKLNLFSLIIEYAYDCLVTLDKVYNKIPTTEGYFLKFMHNELNMVMNDRKDHHEDWWKHEKCYIVKDKNGNDYYQNCNWENGEYDFEDFAVKAGYCYDYPGRFDNCMSFDITSSYPHHIMQFNISAEVKVIHPTKEQIESGEVILSDVNEVGFRRTDNAILPTIVKKVFNERKHYKTLMKEAKKNHDYEKAALYDNRQGVKKIIINSMYGVCLSSRVPLI